MSSEWFFLFCVYNLLTKYQITINKHIETFYNNISNTTLREKAGPSQQNVVSV